MPDYQLIPADHDPFGSFIRVDHDPFSTDQDQALASSMTHWPEAPNPVPGIIEKAKPYLKGAAEFIPGYGRGASQVLKDQGVQLPEWSNRVGGVLQSEAANTAIGVAGPPGRIATNVFRAKKFDEGFWQLPETLSKVKDLIAQGKTASEIGDAFDVSRMRIKAFLKDQGLKTQYGRGQRPIKSPPEPSLEDLGYRFDEETGSYIKQVDHDPFASQ